jgi:hypothetical protein
MPVNQFTVGRDVSLVLNGPSGQVQLDGLTDFSAKPMTTTLKSKPLGGKPIFGYIPDGWELSFKLDRLNPAVDKFWADFEASYYAGGNQIGGTVYETILESDGSISEYRYEGFVMKLDNPGDFSGDKKVEQTLSGLASIKVAVVNV